ncbi:MAG: riboflavin kinase / adenylyltransferase [Actinomycetota bacterium]|jgi:riboflavin kinase/FMN adenylyltransferase|nr:riboflavin kinase / adenylyltransferase [Actinomycetota bacterium]
MDVVTDLAAMAPPGAGSAVTIGAYDGVHLGHRAVLGELRRLADATGAAATVVTFDRHPATVVRPSSAPKLLTDLEQKLEVLEETGSVDVVVVVPFDWKRSQEEPEDFVKEILVDGLAARTVIVGEDFHFGRNRRGTVRLLAAAGARWGFEVVGLGLVDVPGVDGPVSSTLIRRRLAAGDVDGAAALLGRMYEVRGVVSPGDHRGQELGFPTANVEVPADILLPAAGIYAGWYVRPDGTCHQSAISLGTRPTFHPAGSPLVLEAYLLDFTGDLYGEPGRVRFARRLRDEVRFESADALSAQVAADVAATRAALALANR